MSTRRSTRLAAVFATSATAPKNEEPNEDTQEERPASASHAAPDDEYGQSQKADSESDGGESDGGGYRESKRRKLSGGKNGRTARRGNAAGTKSVSTKANPAARSRMQGRLKNFMNMPLDVIVQILEDVHLVDLVSLARSGKNICQFLRSPAQTRLWKAAREDDPNLPVPRPPSGMSEIAWAFLLFGGSGCYTCKAKNIQVITFELQRRACIKCKKACLVCDMDDEYAELCVPLVKGKDWRLKDLLGFTTLDRNWHAGYRNKDGYWLPDIEAMKQHIQKLRLSGSETALEEFIERRVAQVKANAEEVDTYEAWVEEKKHLASQDRALVREENYDKIRSRLLSAGYQACDLSSVWSQVDGKRELRTEKALSRVQSQAEAGVIKARDTRLALEARNRTRVRSRKALFLYHRYLESIITAQWRYLPTLSSLERTGFHQLPCFHRLIKDERVEIPEEEWENAAAVLPQELSPLLVARLSVLAPVSSDLPAFPALYELAPASDGSTPDVLNALSSRFLLLDLAQVMLHFSKESDWRERFSRGIIGPKRKPVLPIMTAFAQLMKKDDDIDARELDIACGDLWFKCSTCSVDFDTGTHTAVYHGWRSFLKHCVDRQDCCHQPEVVPAHLFPEARSPSYFQHWACTHCTEYREVLQSTSGGWNQYTPCHDINIFIDLKHDTRTRCEMGTRSQLIEHNKNKHSIPDPREHYDFFYCGAFENEYPTYTSKVDYTAVAE